MFSLLMVDLHDLSLQMMSCVHLSKRYICSVVQCVATYSVHDNRSKAKCPDFFLCGYPTQKSFAI
jgi:hypothetical protein